MQEPDRLGPVDPKRRIVNIGVRPLQSCATARDEVGAAVRRGPEQQTPGKHGFCEVVVVAAEDVTDAAAVDIPSTTRSGVRWKPTPPPNSGAFPCSESAWPIPAPPIEPKTTGLGS